MELIKYQLNTAGEGFAKNSDSIVLTSATDTLEAPLKTADLETPLETLVDYFKVLEYFPEVSFYLEDPVELDFEISFDYVLGQSVSGLCKTEFEGTKLLNVWQAEHKNSTLFRAGETMRKKARNYLIEEDKTFLSGWMFFAPFLYQGIFRDKVLRQRVLIEMEKLIYLNQTEEDHPTLASVRIDSYFSADNPCWNENIPVLE